MNHLFAQAAGLFTAPALAWIGLAAVSIPIIIHLMSRFRRRPEPWGAMRFLIEAYRKQRKRLQIEKLLLLLVRCLVVALAGLALAGPALSGCAENGSFFSPSGGRVVYLVIDDALSTQTREAGGTRLEGLKAEALKVVGEMKEGDRAVVIRMAKPIRVVTDAPISDQDALRGQINAIEPRYSGGGLIDALVAVQQSMDANNVRDGDGVVVLLSDFSRSAGYFEQPLPPELEGLGERATIVTALPPDGTDNVQVMSLTPRRRMIVASSTGSTAVGIEVRLRRFGGEGQGREVKLQVRVLDHAGNAVAEQTRLVTWMTGQRQALANLDLPVVLPADQVGGAGRELVVEARIVPESAEAGVDALEADNAAAAVVRLRSQLQVALVDDESDVNPVPGGLEPWQLAQAALSPRGPGAVGAFELTTLQPTSLNTDSLEAYDAALVLRPDEVTTRGWDALRTFAERGGLVWVFVPAADTDPGWADAMKRAFALSWAFGDRVVRVTDGLAEGAPTPAPMPVDETAAPPNELQFLAADWREKLGWVSVEARLPLTTTAEDQWIVMNTKSPATLAPEMPVLMAHRPVGQGALVFTATALDTRYTNLPIRALFVPLMHDTLRGVLGNTEGAAPLTAGQTPALGLGWRGVGEITRVIPMGAGEDDTTREAKVLVQTEGNDVAARGALELPGVYQGSVAGSPKLLAVNPDADAGDTFGGRAPLEQLLDGLGGWSYLQERADAGGVLAQTRQRTDLTWALLWVLLALVLLETLLARWFSHATDHDRPTIIGRVLGALHGGDSTNASASATPQAGRAA